MPAKMGRPLKGETPKSAQVGFRVSPETAERFDECRRLSGKSKVELFEQMVNDLYQRLKRK